MLLLLGLAVGHRDAVHREDAAAARRGCGCSLRRRVHVLGKCRPHGGRQSSSWQSTRLEGAAPASTITFPPPDKVMVSATQQIPTLFMCILPAFATVPVTAESTAVLDTYAEVPIKPRGDFWQGGGDEPLGLRPQCQVTLSVMRTAPRRSTLALHNTDRDKMPYGYLFRIDVPATYSSGQLKVEIFDPDCYNAPVEPQYIPHPPGPNITNPDWSAGSHAQPSQRVHSHQWYRQWMAQVLPRGRSADARWVSELRQQLRDHHQIQPVCTFEPISST